MKLFGKISAKELAQLQLSDAQRELVLHSSAAEYHAAMTTMLKQRIERIRAESGVSDIEGSVQTHPRYSHIDTRG